MKKISKLLSLFLLAITILVACSKQDEASPVNPEISSKLNGFIKSTEFKTLQANFNINADYLKAENTSINDMYNPGTIEKTGAKYIILPVVKDNVTIGQIWLYTIESDPGKFRALYESLENYSEKTGGSSTVYFSNGELLMNLNFVPETNGMKYSIKSVADVKIGIATLASTTPMSRVNKVALVQPEAEGVVDCTIRVYQAAKKACEGDAFCDTICDFTPTCHASMLAAAAGACIIN